MISVDQSAMRHRQVIERRGRLSRKSSTALTVRVQAVLAFDRAIPLFDREACLARCQYFVRDELDR